uniref:Uncharacterized protein MANES_18G104800 n=1 Tax=Rhizophora mucronata TaxID=61149 RepID=A0A2P2NL40_RHIMU
MDRRILPGFEIPPASLQSFTGVVIILSVPIYDRVFVPVARSLTGKPAGITTLQRTGAGLVLSILCTVVSALVETKRLETAEKFGVVDQPNATVPMSVWWLIPQYALCGASNVFCLVALQEFFYDQVPTDLRNMGLALYLSVQGVGSFLSSFLISVIDKATDGDAQKGWFANNINRAHLDYFYWLLTVLGTVSFIAYLYFARSYVYFKPSQSDLMSP